MEQSEDIFADLLSGLQPPAVPKEPVREETVSMEESRRRASDNEEAVPVRRSNSPVGDNLRPPPPPLTREEMQTLVRENVRELLFQSFGALTTTLRGALTGVNEKLVKLECLNRDLSEKVDKVMQHQTAECENVTDSFRRVEATLKEAHVGIQRTLEKQDLLDAHVLLNRHAREEQQERREAEARKSEKRMTEEMEEDEEVNPPAPVAVPKRPAQSNLRPTNYLPPEPKRQDPAGYVQEEKVESKQPGTYFQPETQRPLPTAPQTTPPGFLQPMPLQQPVPVSQQSVYQPTQAPRQATSQLKPPPPSNAYPMIEQGGYVPPPPVDKSPPQPVQPYVQSSQFGAPPPPMQQMHFSGYPSMQTPPPIYRPVQPVPPPSHPAIYGSPASLQNPKGPGTREVRSSPQSVPLDQVINDVAKMGFDRTKVRSVVTDMLDHNESVDVNMVIDRVMKMG